MRLSSRRLPRALAQLVPGLRSASISRPRLPIRANQFTLIFIQYLQGRDDDNLVRNLCSFGPRRRVVFHGDRPD